VPALSRGCGLPQGPLGHPDAMQVSHRGVLWAGDQHLIALQSGHRLVSGVVIAGRPLCCQSAVDLGTVGTAMFDFCASQPASQALPARLIISTAVAPPSL